jgi:fructose-1,6-bisphosphatase
MLNTGKASAYHNTNKMASYFMMYNHFSMLSLVQNGDLLTIPGTCADIPS